MLSLTHVVNRAWTTQCRSPTILGTLTNSQKGPLAASVLYRVGSPPPLIWAGVSMMTFPPAVTVNRPRGDKRRLRVARSVSPGRLPAAKAGIVEERFGMDCFRGA